ncbi:alpha/beta hydrolase [Paenibacillus thalictri]|uniref:Alpha/beta hydrolase n=1 Tax=Paenibacillus thalictri TaxID=2527873 RepID=A0A4Q9DML7_9BACL|nr:alpha/beta hydrolase [Paenibacillus thalictri]TBL76590.1 alpha/beta hydrolase [Paenibacillus thalictri]
MSGGKHTHVYKTVNDCRIQADVSHSSHNAATLVYFHGGALISGSRTMLPDEQIDLYMQAGFNVVSVDYRLAPETKLPIIAEDIRDAIRWVRTEAADLYRFDPDRIAFAGGSAGGYLALLAGTGIDGYRPKAVVSFYGYGDILGDWYTQPSEFYCRMPLISQNRAYGCVGGAERSEGSRDRRDFYWYCRQNGVWVQEVTGYDPVKDRLQLLPYNPIDQISSDYPPTLLLHGTDDTDVPYEQSLMMHEQLHKAGVDSKLITMDGAGHDFDKNETDPSVKQAFASVVRFLQEHV